MSGAQPEATAASSSARPAEGTESRKVSFQRPSAAPSRASSSADQPTSSSGTGTSSTSQAYSAYSGVTRRHSLFGTEDRVVLDIGSRYSKFGFSGEPRPRAIVPSVSFSQPSTSYLRLDTASPSTDPYNIGDTLWDLDFERCADDQLRRGKRALLLAQLTQLLRKAFTQHLMVDPKQRKVLVVENPMLPNAVKEMIYKVLFNNLQVPSVSFVPAPLLSLLAVGRITGLVLESGYLETTLMPVYYGRPLTSHLASSPRAGKQLNERLKRLLLRYGKFVAAQVGLQDCAKPISERTRAIDAAMLTNDRLEQIKAKALFASPHETNLEGLEELFSVLELGSAAGEKDEAAASIKRMLSSTSKATHFTFSISPESIDPNGTASLIQSVSAPPSSSTSSFGNTSQKAAVSGVIAIPGWLRERAAELLFESGDEDEPSIVDMTVSAIARLPIDLRRVMCENVLVSGGTAMLPGFANRFRTQLAAAVERAERSGGELSIDRHLRQVKGAKVEEAREEKVGSKLHDSIAVLNDPWPDMANAKSKEGGTAPAFAANLLPWMGASLAGALKTTSLDAISREEYDEANKTLHGGDEAVEGEVAREKKEDKASATESSKTTRPAVPMASKRGSFVGVVGGLETGAFGGLAAVSRHIVGIPGSGSGSSGGGGQSRPSIASPTSPTKHT